MNIVPILLGGYGLLAAGYKLTRRSVESVVSPDEKRETPAVEINDGADFVPTRPLVLYGHHWMSIAGTSPIIASIVGLVWGWVPALLWMILGVIFIGGVHDYYALMISIKNRGKSMGEVVSRSLSVFSGKLVSILLAFGGILVYAIFLSVIAGALVATPTAVIPTVALIPIAILCGFLLKRGMSLGQVTLIGMLLTACFVFVGLDHPYTPRGFSIVTPIVFEGDAAPFAIQVSSANVWILFFVIYTFFAIYTPVWMLLQPRDYLNSGVLIFGLLLGILGLMVGHPAIKFPAFHGFMSSKGPLWPMLFITISCGAASGWHSLICAGTTSKQLDNEKNGFFIAYGGMLGETVMAVLSACLIMTTFTYEELIATGLNSSSIGLLFGKSLGTAIGNLGISPIAGQTIGILAISALTLTTLDSFARTGRYVVQELGTGTPLERPLISSLFVTACGVVLYAFVPFMSLWHGLVLSGLMLLLLPLFVLIRERMDRKMTFDRSFILHVILPVVLILPTAAAGMLKLFHTYFLAEKTRNYISGSIDLFLILLLIKLVYDVFFSRRPEPGEDG